VSTNRRALCSWSGGKDARLALHIAVADAPRFRWRIPVCVRGLRSYTGPAEYGGDEFWFADLAGA
jgi:hypothetical protein